MQKTIILAAMNSGFFRTKSLEKQAIILEELAGVEELAQFDRETIAEVLEAETLRRHVVYQARAKRSIDKASQDAAKPLTGGTDSADSHVKPSGPGNYVFTMAQNNTDIDSIFWGALQTFAKHHNATIVVGKVTYNKNGFLQGQEDIEGMYYAPEVLPYLVDAQISYGPIHFIGQANVSPTAKNPLTGFESITEPGISIVIPSSKIALKCGAALKGAKGKILFGTGACTKRNYITRKAGAVAATEHNIGALFVSIDENGEYTARQLELMPGSIGFYDEGMFFSSTAIECEMVPSVMQLGDVHAEKMTSCNLENTLDLLRYYKPQHLMLHDLCDFSSRNHHGIKDCTFIYKHHIAGNTVETDLVEVCNVLNDFYSALPSSIIHIVESNHDLALERWLKEADFKKDPENALIYLRCMLGLYEHAENGKDFNALDYALKLVSDNATFLDLMHFHTTDESVIIAGVEHGCHGHNGLNGARATPAQFRTLGKLNTGHTHSPSIVGGVYTAGVSASLEMGYNVGPSSWQLAHILTWPNGQRQIIFM